MTGLTLSHTKAIFHYVDKKIPKDSRKKTISDQHIFAMVKIEQECDLEVQNYIAMKKNFSEENLFPLYDYFQCRCYECVCVSTSMMTMPMK